MYAFIIISNTQHIYKYKLVQVNDGANSSVQPVNGLSPLFVQFYPLVSVLDKLVNKTHVTLWYFNLGPATTVGHQINFPAIEACNVFIIIYV